MVRPYKKILASCLTLIQLPSSMAFTSPESVPLSSTSTPLFLTSKTQLRQRSLTILEDHEPAEKCEPCPEPEADFEMDRREATFAMLGAIWSVGVIPSVALSSNAAPAQAVYGTDANIAMPNVMEGISDRLNKQCLVESLGNRDCLVYLDPENKLYKGADGKELFERLEKSTEYLSTIPALVAEKKWSKVQGVITGPMGSLGTTMDTLSKMSENEVQLCQIEKRIKNSLYAISAAVERKEGSRILENHERATQDLILYAKAL